MSFKKQNPLVVALYLPQFYETDYNKVYSCIYGIAVRLYNEIYIG